jgi:phosphatidate cytidylyltransferase
MPEPAAPARPATPSTLRQRLMIALLLVPPGLMCILAGGIWYFAVMIAIVGLAAYEYAQMMGKTGARPAQLLIIAGAPLLAATASLHVLRPAALPDHDLLTEGTLAALLVAVTLWHVIDFERGAPSSGTDWAVSVGGILYFGWMCHYFVFMREALPDGLGWTLVILPSIWLADSGGYVTGKAWGRHAMSPRLSPKKTWEGFVGGLVWGLFFGGLFGWLLSLRGVPGSTLNAASGALVGLISALSAVLGDLSISMFKRQVGIKDTSNLLGAHGGLLDRIDSWLIAGPVAYYVILFFLK